MDGTDDVVKRPSNGSLMSVVTMSTIRNSMCGSRRGSAARGLLTPPQEHQNGSYCTSPSASSSTSDRREGEEHGLPEVSQESQDQNHFEMKDEPRPGIRVLDMTKRSSFDIESDPGTASTMADDVGLPPLPPVKMSWRTKSRDEFYKNNSQKHYHVEDKHEPNTAVTFV